MSSAYLCGSMALLSEKESLHNWEQSHMFSDLMPSDATAHSLEYLRVLVARSGTAVSGDGAAAAAATATAAHQSALHTAGGGSVGVGHLDAAAAAASLAVSHVTGRTVAAAPPIVIKPQVAVAAIDAAAAVAPVATTDGGAGGDDGGNAAEAADASASAPETATAPKPAASSTGFVFEVAATDEATLDMFLKMEEDEDEVTRRKHDAIDGEAADAAALSANQQAGVRRPRDDGSTGANANAPSAAVARPIRHQLDVVALAKLLNFKPASGERYRGRIKTFLFDHGYGFVQPHAALELARRAADENGASLQLALPSALSSAEATAAGVLDANRGDANIDAERLRLLECLPMPATEIELFVSIEDVCNLAAPSAGGDHPSAARALKMPCPGEEVEFSVAVAQTHAGRSLRAVRLTGPDTSPLIVQMPSMRQRGVVRLYDATRKFGFLTPIGGPPPGLATLTEGRLLLDAAQAMRKSTDVFTLASSVVWDSSVPVAERALVVGSVVEYTAVLRRSDPGRSFSSRRGGANGNNGGGGADQQQGGSRVVAVCVTDFGYRPVDPTVLERTVGADVGGRSDGGRLALAAAAGSLMTARPGLLTLPSSSGSRDAALSAVADLLDGNIAW